MSPPRTSTGNVATGSVAGSPVGLPVRRSKREPCSQHSTVHSSTSPSLSATAACEQMSSTAKTSSPLRATATSWSPERHRERLVLEDVGQGAGSLERHERSFSTFFSSSASTVAFSDSSMAGTPILRIRSLKKPCTTRRRASASETPRERR